jgi:S-methylmethionine-dependent homocysteine/selenocysteine methylase
VSHDRPTLLDGALGTELARRGGDLAAPLWSARALVEDPDAITEIHQDYLRAGAEVLTTCTFRTHERSLHGGCWTGRGAQLNRTAVACARAAISREGRSSVRVAGSIGPLEDCFRPDLVPPRDELVREHAAQARSLRDAGVDLLLVETMGTQAEASAAVAAAVATGLPTWCSFTTSSPCRLVSGEPLRDGVAAVEDLGAEAVLVNCVPAQEVRADVEALAACATITFGAYPGLGHARGVDGFREDLVLDPEDFAQRLLELRDLGAEILGGCCGTRPEHLAAVHGALPAP